MDWLNPDVIRAALALKGIEGLAVSIDAPGRRVTVRVASRGRVVESHHTFAEIEAFFREILPSAPSLVTTG